MRRFAGIVESRTPSALYYKYAKQGGTKTPTQFVSELIDLIG